MPYDDSMLDEDEIQLFVTELAALATKHRVFLHGLMRVSLLWPDEQQATKISQGKILLTVERKKE